VGIGITLAAVTCDVTQLWRHQAVK